MITPEATSHRNTTPSVGRALGHVVELASLQGRLFMADLREGSHSARAALALAGVGLAALIASAPLALTAVALWLRDSQGLSTPAALLWTAAGGALVGVLCGVAAWRAGRNGLAMIARSYRDLEENLHSLAPDDESPDDDLGFGDSGFDARADRPHAPR